MENQEQNQAPSEPVVNSSPALASVSDNKKKLVVLLGVLAVVVVLGVLVYASKMALPVIGQEARMPSPLPSISPRALEADITQELQRIEMKNLDNELKAIDRELQGL